MKKIPRIVLLAVSFASFFYFGCKNNAQSTSATATEKSAPTIQVSKAEQDEIDKIPDKNAYIKGLIGNALVKGEKVVTLKPGIYRLNDTLLLENINKIDLHAQGVTLVMTKGAEVIRIRKCSDFSIRGLTIDYDPIPFTQGTITSISEDAKTIEFELHQGYRNLESSGSGQFKGYPRHFFDKKTRLWKKNINYFIQPTLEMAADGRKGKANFNIPQIGVEVGDYIAFDRRWVDKSAAVHVRETTGPVLFEDITLHGAPGLAFCGRTCEGQTTFRRVKIERGPRPEGATEDRLMSSNADGVNFADCRIGPIIEDCDFGFMGDDSLNVHGRFLAVVKVKSPTEVLLLHPRKPESFVQVMKDGDIVRFVEGGTFLKVGEGKFQSISIVEGTEGVTPEEVAKYYEEYKDLTKSYTIYSMKLSAPVDFVKPGQWIDMPAINAPNFVIRNNYFHDHRARGLRIMGDDGLVEGNRFERIGTAAIQIGPELKFWREAGWVHNLTVRNNQIKDLGFAGELAKEGSYVPAAIVICARIDAEKPPYPTANENIVIENNVIDGCPMGAVYAYGAKDVTLRNNKAKNVLLELTPSYKNRFGLNPKKAFDYEWVTNVKDEGNIVEGNSK